MGRYAAILGIAGGAWGIASGLITAAIAQAVAALGPTMPQAAVHRGVSAALFGLLGGAGACLGRSRRHIGLSLLLAGIVGGAAMIQAAYAAATLLFTAAGLFSVGDGQPGGISRRSRSGQRLPLAP